MTTIRAPIVEAVTKLTQSPPDIDMGAMDVSPHNQAAVSLLYLFLEKMVDKQLSCHHILHINSNLIFQESSMAYTLTQVDLPFSRLGKLSDGV